MKARFRFVASSYFIYLLLFVPFCFLAVRHIPLSLYEGFTWDDQLAAWLNETFTTDAGHRWIVDTTALPLVVWMLRFTLGALEEVRFSHDTTLLYVVETLGRWSAIAFGLLLLPSIASLLLFHIMQRLAIWRPLTYGLPALLLIPLYLWAWRYGKRRIHWVQKVYLFERLKR